ncbi:hypothetical protein AWM70_07975 [Paenibacillus yonginensis]|uniref:Uncharacterized protein n=1 Tax=Paenibacillus yonginensis TaxID=1462996 RepID=A0A1B1MZC2_9BACL|nr:hypothetical protein [Paenibacillus yonginensis]ANS74530.1 hypothetical protein AWM70_07975 [Paenibacillus yonginensis]
MYNFHVDRQRVPHPVITNTRQVASNQILFSYDQRTDMGSAINLSNYWIRSNAGPNGIASVNMGDMLSSSNALKPEMAIIRPIDHSKMNFTMTFANRIPSGILYILLPCFVNLEGSSGYTGENWGPFSMNMFIGI